MLCDLTPHPFSSIDYQTHYYLFTGVSSCYDVIHLYRLLWASVVLNVIALFLGIITAAILGAYKDIVSISPKKIHPFLLPNKEKNLKFIFSCNISDLTQMFQQNPSAKS